MGLWEVFLVEDFEIVLSMFFCVVVGKQLIVRIYFGKIFYFIYILFQGKMVFLVYTVYIWFFINFFLELVFILFQEGGRYCREGKGYIEEWRGGSVCCIRNIESELECLRYKVDSEREVGKVVRVRLWKIFFFMVGSLIIIGQGAESY